MSSEEIAVNIDILYAQTYTPYLFVGIFVEQWAGFQTELVLFQLITE